VFEALNKFVEIGEEFMGGVEAHNLRVSIKNQSKAYFQTFHKSEIEVSSYMRFYQQLQCCDRISNRISLASLFI
jgi:hypothetical protein